MSALTDPRHDSQLGSHSRLPADNNSYRGGSLERGNKQKSQPTHSGLQNTSLTQDHSSKQGTRGATSTSRFAKSNDLESFSSSSHSDY
jgi:hypothetical protein